MTTPTPDPEHDRWEGFYADRAKPCPFFGVVPDENLVEWVEAGEVPRGRALDIGCGNGRNALYLARQGWQVQAVDFSSSAVRWAREEVAQAGADVSVTQANVFEHEPQGDAFDFIYDSGCFHHITPAQRAAYVNRVVHWLRPGGCFGLVCFTPEGGSGYSDEEVLRRGSLGGGLGYSAERLSDIWSEGLQVQALRRMRPHLPDGDRFGRDFLWVLRARKPAGTKR